jgi:hypothetical protein
MIDGEKVLLQIREAQHKLTDKACNYMGQGKYRGYDDAVGRISGLEMATGIIKQLMEAEDE